MVNLTHKTGRRVRCHIITGAGAARANTASFDPGPERRPCT